MRWLITDRGDQDVRRLIDGEGFNGKPHYSRQTPGDVRFTRNGQNLIFVTPCLRAAWITFRPTPGLAKRKDGFEAWECALFRNEGAGLSSSLIYEAVDLSWAIWGEPPRDGLITFIRADKIRSTNPGCCYKHAGWEYFYTSPKGYLGFRAPWLLETPDIREWTWKGERGGKLRRELELQGVVLAETQTGRVAA